MSESPNPPSADSSDPEARSPIALLAAVTATWVVGQLSYYAQPQMLDPIKTHFARGDEAVGLMYGNENLAYAITGLAAAGALARLSRVRVAMLGSLILIAANTASGFIAMGDPESFSLLQLSRVLAGIGAGLIGAAGTVSAAGSSNPQRVFAIVTFGAYLLIAAEPPLLPLVLTPFGASGGFFSIAILAAVAMPLYLWLLPPRKSAAEEEGSVWTALRQAPNRMLALAAMAAVFIYETGQGGVFTFIAEIGTRSGLDEQAVGNALGATALAGLSGAALATWLGDRVGMRLAIVLGITLNVVAACALALSQDATLYVVLNLLWNSSYYFVVPYLMAVMAKLDGLGRWVVAMDAIWWLGDAAGPPVAGSIVERSGYDLLSLFPLLTGLVCIAIFVRLIPRINKLDDPHDPETNQ